MEKLIENKDVEEIDESPVQAADSDRYVNYIPHLCVARFDKVSSRGPCSMRVQEIIKD